MTKLLSSFVTVLLLNAVICMANETGNSEVAEERAAEDIMVVLCHRVSSELPSMKFSDLLQIRNGLSSSSGSGILGNMNSRYFDKDGTREMGDGCKIKLDVHVDQKAEDGKSHLIVEVKHPSIGYLPIYYAIIWTGKTMPDPDIAYYPIYSSKYYLFFEGKWLSDESSSTKMVVASTIPKEVVEQQEILDALCPTLGTPEPIALPKLLDLRFAFLGGLWRSEHWDFVSEYETRGDCYFSFGNHIDTPHRALIVTLTIIKGDVTIEYSANYPKWSDVPNSEVEPRGKKKTTKEVDAVFGLSFGLITKTVEIKSFWSPLSGWVSEDGSDDGAYDALFNRYKAEYSGLVYDD